MANNFIPRIELNGLPGTYYKLYVNGASPVTYPFSFNIGTTPVSVNKTGNTWTVVFTNTQNVVVQLTSFTNNYLSFTNMDVYMFSCANDNVFAYMLYLNGNSYIFNYKGVLVDDVINGGYINNWRIVPSLNSVYFNFCSGLNAVANAIDNVYVPFDLLSLEQVVENLQPSNVQNFTLLNGVGSFTNPNITPTTVVSFTYTPGGASGDAVGGFTYSIVGNTVTINAGSSTDNSTVQARF